MDERLRPASDGADRARHAVRTCLVLGGARSGKSSFAQELAEASGRTPVYVATAAVWDDEMRDRVERHRAVRNERWRTVEEPLALADVLVREAVPGTVVVVDCLTLWLTNLMLGGHDTERAASQALDALSATSGAIILVSNEVGSGIVPENALARRFRDEQGRLNQAVAKACEAAVLVTAGLPLVLKPSLGPILSI